MSMIYDNWERLVAAVLKRQEIWQLCHAQSPSLSPSLSSGSSESFPSSRSSDELESDHKPVPKLVFLGGSSPPRFRLKTTLKGLKELGKGARGTTILTELLHDVYVWDQELVEKGTKMATKLVKWRVCEDEFKERMMVFGNCRHQNVGAPKAYYFSNKPNGKLILYDYYCQGSVFDMLHGKKHLGRWERRMKVAIGAARGIAHIHNQGNGKMAHGNIKSSNIFLNSHHYGCVSDFGLTRTRTRTRSLKLCPPHHDRKMIINSINLSQDCDVYSFGVLLLELLTGKPRRNGDTGLGSDVHILTWVRSIKYEEFSEKLFDPGLGYDEEDRLEMVEVLCVAMRCLEVHRMCRTNMGDVLLMLDSIISRPYKIWSGWM